MKVLIKVKRILRKKLKVTFCSTVFVCIFFLIYQYFYSTELFRVNPASKKFHKQILPKEIVPQKNVKISASYVSVKKHLLSVRGVHQRDRRYKPDANNKFICFTSGEKISFDKVNDNYCDCEEDGSDEPGTNACNNGVFFCSTEGSYRDIRAIPTYQVNDGICDCCDGSDEWEEKKWTSGLSAKLQEHLGTYQSPCKNVCFRHQQPE